MQSFEKLLSRVQDYDYTQYLDEILGVLLVLLLAWVVIALSRRAIRLFAKFAMRGSVDPEDLRRVETLARVFRYLSTIVIFAITVMLVLAQIGISIAPILGAAGVVGLAVGFGAQSLVKDFFTGFVLLLENQIRQGDIVEVAGKAGVVEGVTLRTVRLRGYDGNVHFVPTGMIETVTNMTMEFSQAVMDIGVAYRENTDEVVEIMRATAKSMREDETFAPKILDDIDIAGVDKWADSSVVIRCRIRVIPLEQFTVRREYLRRLKHAFDEHDIEIPFPHITVYAGAPKSGRAPAMPLSFDGGSPLDAGSVEKRASEGAR